MPPARAHTVRDSKQNLPRHLQFTRGKGRVDDAEVAPKRGIRIAKVGFVGNVESLAAQLELDPFCDREILDQARIELPEAEAANAVSWRISKRRIGWRSGISGRVQINN